MPGIGDTLRSERRRQGRTLADAAAETRVRESYLAAIEEDDFEVLGGDVYARGFIKLYGRYLGLDADALVDEYRTNHEKPEEITAIPGATMDDFTPVSSGGPPSWLTQPVLAAVAVVGILVVLFIVFRGGGEAEEDEIDPNAPGPEPAASEEPALEGDEPLVGTTGTDDPASGDTASGVDPTDAAEAPGTAETPLEGGDVLEEVVVTVTAVEEVRLDVIRGQPVVSNALLEPGESRTLSDPDNEQVVFTVSDFTGADITVNGGPLVNPDFAGQAVEISCTVGETVCNATPL